MKNNKIRALRLFFLRKKNSCVYNIEYDIYLIKNKCHSQEISCNRICCSFTARELIVRYGL